MGAHVQGDGAVIGGGISGGMVADEFAAHGHEVVLVDGRDSGWGSTAASTALLQYEIDTPMMELAARFGEDAAVLAYRACVEGVGQLLSKAADLRNVGSARVASVQYASRRGHVGQLRAEYEFRARHGVAVDWLGPGIGRASCRARVCQSV